MSEQAAPSTEGIGLSLENVRALLAKEHETVVDKNDPILMVVTILNAHLTEVEKLHSKHKEALSRLMAEKTEVYLAGVQSGLTQLTESLSSASVEGIRQIFDAHASKLESFKHAVFGAAAVVGVSALVNVAVFVLLARG